MNAARKPMGLMDYGLAGLCCAGTEAAQDLMGKGIVGLDITLPSTVLTQIGITDSAMTGFDAEALTVGDVGFLTGWTAFKNTWSTFKGNNDTQFKILKNSPTTVLAEVQQFQETLNQWRTRYQQLTGKTPSGPTLAGPNAPPKPPPDTGWSLSTKILIGIAATIVVGGAGYATYRYVQTAKRSTRRGKKFLENELSSGLTTGHRAVKLALQE
jgi:hypothetical protein